MVIADVERPKIVTVMWAIWTSRNNLTHEKGSLDPRQSMRRVSETLALLQIPGHLARVLPGHGWRPPETNWVKINTDAGISIDVLRGGAGGNARSATGFVRDGVIFAKLRGFS